LLGAGSKPLQLFGLRKTPELSLALRQALSPLGRSGLSSSTGGCRSTARSHILPKFLDTRGIGAWSDAEIKRAIAQGISKDGSHLKPPIGYEWYARMTDADLSAIVAYVRTVLPKE